MFSYSGDHLFFISKFTTEVKIEPDCRFESYKLSFFPDTGIKN